jgi:hypothetical protein
LRELRSVEMVSADWSKKSLATDETQIEHR